MRQELSVVRGFPAPGDHLCGMAWDGQHLWHSDADTDRIYCLDPESGSVLRDIPCEDVRTDLTYDGIFLWQVAGRPKRIRVIDPQTGHVQDEIDLGPNAENVCGLLVTGEEYWIGLKDEGSIEGRSLDDHSTIVQFEARPHVDGLALLGTTLWYTSFDESLLVAIDTETGEEKQRFRVPGKPTGMCCDEDFFWYSDYANQRICAVNPFEKKSEGPD